MNIRENITELIGNTPMVYLRNFGAGLDTALAAKLELFNPYSIKDRPVRAMIWVTAALIALGGCFGGLNTMYAAFAARVRELGALQTLGFPRRALAISFLQESLLATSAGGILAAIVSLVGLNGVAVRFSMGAFALVVDAPVLLGGLAAGAGLAVIGVIPPLWRCLRLPITEALRAG